MDCDKPDKLFANRAALRLVHAATATSDLQTGYGHLVQSLETHTVLSCVATCRRSPSKMRQGVFHTTRVASAAAFHKRCIHNWRIEAVICTATRCRRGRTYAAGGPKDRCRWFWVTTPKMRSKAHIRAKRSPGLASSRIAMSAGPIS
jgi:hypothetical protein